MAETLGPVADDRPVPPPEPVRPPTYAESTTPRRVAFDKSEPPLVELPYLTYRDPDGDSFLRDNWVALAALFIAIAALVRTF